MSKPTHELVHDPSVYEVGNIEEAKSVIVTPEGDRSTDERWSKETEFLATDIGRHLNLGADDCVLDYGCGIGRLSKALIETCGCRVIGVDASQSMRLLAPEYVLSDRFLVWSPGVLTQMVQRGFRCDKAIVIWVLQHVLRPPVVIDLIADALIENADCYVLNQASRVVPTNRGYINDGRDVAALLERRFTLQSASSLPAEVAPAVLVDQARIRLLRKKPSSIVDS